jgi:hypothetical protein
MNVETGAEAALFPEKEYINGIFVTVRVCPLNWSIHCNFTGDGKCNKGVGVHPHPHQPGLILPSWLNVRQKAAIATLCTLWSWLPWRTVQIVWDCLPPPLHSTASILIFNAHFQTYNKSL